MWIDGDMETWRHGYTWRIEKRRDTKVLLE